MHQNNLIHVETKGMQMSVFESIEGTWPEKGDQLFISADDWWHNACLNYRTDNWELYIRGYKLAADKLVEDIKTNHNHQDFLIFPIAFLYRQYIELRMKKIIIDGNWLMNRETEFPILHNLSDLWTNCKSLIKNISSKYDEHWEEMIAVDDYINQFSLFDPSSTAFRYPVGTDKKASIPYDVKHINLRNLSDVMNKLETFLEAVAMQFLVYIDNEQDMDANMRDYVGL